MSSAGYLHHHAVQFYSEEKNLYETVASFLGQGFLEGEPAILIATGWHTAGILEQLQQRMIDVKRAQRLGDLVVFDADRLLETVAPTDVPDYHRIEDSIGELMQAFARRHGRQTQVRLYGEMVDLCWKQGRYNTALRIEVFWNELSKRHRIASLCGYAMRNFLNETMLFDEVCRQHTSVVPARLAH